MLVGWFAKMSWCYSCVQQGYKIKKKKMYCRSWEFLFLPSGSFLVLTLVNLKNTLPASVFHSRAAVGATSTQREEASLASLADKPSTPFHIYCTRARLMSPANLARPLIQFQAGTGDPRINLVNSLLRPTAFIFLIFFFFTQRDLELPWNVFLLLLIKHLILRVTDYKLYADVCSSTNAAYHKTLQRLYLQSVFFFLANFLPVFLRVAAQEKQIQRNLTSVADKYIIVCWSVLCTVWDLPIAPPSRMHCRQSLERRSHFLPPAVKYSVRPEIIRDSFQGLALFKYAGNNGQGIKWSTASQSKESRGFESTARVSHNTIDSWRAVYMV